MNWWFSVEYLLALDNKWAVLLRSEARIGGAPFRIIEMTQVTFNGELASETFAVEGA
jgi:hypothetical protein